MMAKKIKIIALIVAIFSLCVKILWLDKNIFSISKEHLANNIFFWGMLVMFLYTILNRLSKDEKIIIELQKANEELRDVDVENIKEKFGVLQEKFSNEEEYKILSLNWKGYRSSLLITDKKEYFQTVDADEYYNNENLLKEKMNYKLINYIPNLLTGLGMLGTFLGLSIGLATLDLRTDDMKQLIILIAGTKTAFYTSLYGMYFSISMSVIFNIYFGYYEEEILSLRNRLNLIFKKYLEDESLERIKNEIILVQKNTSELSHNVGKELVKGVADYNKTTKEHLRNLTTLVQTNISGLADNVSQAFEEKLEKIFSKEFIEPFKILKNNLLEISRFNNEEIEKYALMVSEVTEKFEKIRVVLNSCSEESLQKFNSIMDRIENKYSEVHNIATESEKMYEKFLELLGNSRDIIASSNQYMSEINKMTSVFSNFIGQEEKLVEFWSSNKNIMSSMIETIEKVKMEELNKIEEYNRKTTEKLKIYYDKFEESKKLQEEKMEEYYREHLVSLFKEYDNSIVKVVGMFTNVLGELESNLNRIERNLSSSNELLQKNIEFVDERYKIAQNDYNNEMKSVSNEYKNMMKTLEDLTQNIARNISKTNELITENNKSLSLREEYRKEAEEKNSKILELGEEIVKLSNKLNEKNNIKEIKNNRTANKENKYTIKER